jgi:RNA polymerase sigma factor (sigma-70 family)
MTPHLAPLVHHVRRLLVPPAAVPDAALLDRFTRDREEAAFAALVARHGSMVMRVCKRVLSDAAGAEDCFQATFLVLARKASSLRRPASLASWLHGVALRIASKARKSARRRRLCQMPANACEPADPRPDPLEQLTARELLVAVDEEVQRLPEVYRLPLILCCLEGLSQGEAARRLGWTAGSVKARLERGRKRLQARLAQRGLILSAALTIATVSQGAVSAAVGPGLSAATIKAATRFAAGKAVKGVETSCVVRALAEAALRNTAGKLKVFALIGLVAIAAAAAGTGIIGKPANGSPQSLAEPLAGSGPVRPAGSADPVPRLDRNGDPLPSGALARLGTLRFRWHHHSMALSSDGRRAICVNYEETRLCDVTTGKTIWRVDNKQGGGGHAVAYSPNGWLAASVQDHGNHQGALFLWETATGKELAKVAVSLPSGLNGTECLAFAPDGVTLAAGGHAGSRVAAKELTINSVVTVWHWTGTALKPLWQAKPDRKVGYRGRRPPGIRSLAFSPDGKYLATGSLASGIIRIWDAVQGKEIRQMKGSGTLIGALAFAPKARVLVSGSEEGAVELWDTATGIRKWQSKQPGEVNAVAFSPDGKTIVAGGGHGYWGTDVKRHEPFLVMLDPGNGREIGRVRTDGNSVNSVAFSKDGKVFAVGLGGALRVWEGIGGKERTAQNGHENSVFSVAVSENGKVAATGANDGVIILWDLATGKEKQRLHGHTGWLRAVGFVPGGKLLASASTDQTVRLWDLATGNEIRRLEGNPEGSLHAIAIAPDGKTLASGDNHANTVDVWNLLTGQRLHALKLDDEQRLGVMCLAFSPDGKMLACGERILRYDETELTSRILLWDAMTGKKRGELPAHKFAVDSLAFSPDGKILVSTGTTDKTLSHWDIETGKRIFELPCALGQGVVALGRGVVAFSPDGKTLAWGSSAGEVWLWETATKKLRRKFSGHATNVKSLAFSPDGRVLVTGSEDTTAMVWDVTGLKSDSTALPALSKDRLRSLWNALAHADAAEAGRSIWALAADPKHAVPFVVERLRALPPGDPQRIPRLVADLDSPTFKVREAAEKRLEALGKLAEPSLRAALTRQVSLEFRRRIEQVLAKREAAIQSPEVLQTLRAMEALEHMATPEARQALDHFAREAPELYFQQEARAAAARLLKR